MLFPLTSSTCLFHASFLNVNLPALNPSFGADIAEPLSRSRLRCLVLSATSLSVSDLIIILRALPRTIEELELCDFSAVPALFQALANVLKTKSITRLHCATKSTTRQRRSASARQASRADSWQAALSTSCHLQELRLNSLIDAAMAQATLAGLATAPGAIRVLDLAHCELSPAALTHVCKLTALRRLRLDFVVDQQLDTAQMLPLVVEALPNLRHLSLVGWIWPAEDFAALATSIVQSPRLAQVNLSHLEPHLACEREEMVGTMMAAWAAPATRPVTVVADGWDDWLPDLNFQELKTELRGVRLVTWEELSPSRLALASRQS